MATSGSSSSETTFVSAENEQKQSPDTPPKLPALVKSFKRHGITELTDRSPGTGPDILIISLGSTCDDFEKDYKELLQRLEKNASVVRAKSCYSAVTWLGYNTPDVVLITDGAIQRENQEYKNVWAAVVSYMQRGGLAILCGYAAAELTPVHEGRFWNAADLDWSLSTFHYLSFGFESDCCNHKLQMKVDLPERVPRAELPKLLEGYARTIIVNEESQIIYAFDENHFYYNKDSPLEKAAMAFGRVGNGGLIYLGETSHSRETQCALMVFCGFSSPDLIHFDECHDSTIMSTTLSEDEMSWTVTRINGTEERCTYTRRE